MRNALTHQISMRIYAARSASRAGLGYQQKRMWTTSASSGRGKRLTVVVLLFLLYIYSLVEPSNASQQNDTTVAPYLLVVISNRIDRLHLNGTYSHTICVEPLNKIEAIDYHYEMQHVYWVVDIPGNDQDQIKRANLSGPADQTPEVVIFPLNDPTDLAVDWIEDKLYWTSSADEKIRVLNIASIDTLYGETEYNFIEVELENAKFTYIILDPINRTMYLVDRLSNVIRGVNYGGKVIRNISTEQLPLCPALSFKHSLIFWYNSQYFEMHARGLANTTLTYHYTLNNTNRFIVEIVYYRGWIYWGQKLPMGIYYTWWEQGDRGIGTVREYSTNQVIRDFTLVDPSKQPHTADEFIEDLYVSEKQSTDLPSIASLPSTVVVSTPYNDLSVTQASSSTMAITQTGLYSTVPITTSISHRTIVKSSSIASTAAVSTPYNGLTATSNSISVPMQTGVHSKPPISTHHTTVKQMKTSSIASTVELMSDAKTSTPLSVTVSSHQPTVHVSTTHTTSRESTPHSPQPTPISPTSSGLPHSSPKTSSTVPQTTSSLAIQSKLTTRATHSSIEHTQSDSQASLHSSQLATSTIDVPLVIPTTSRVQSSTNVQSSIMWYGGTNGNSVSVLPTEIPLVPDSEGSRKSTTLEAITITAACLGMAALLFIGLAVSDAIYYYGCERKRGKNASSGLLGAIWALTKLPFHCIPLPRNVFRKRRRPMYPYVPRCMDISAITSPSEAVTSSSGISSSENITDISILSGNDGHGEIISTADVHETATAQSRDIAQNDRDTSPMELTQLELETKIALDLLDLDSDCEKEEIF